jgi:hypothetical protein
LRDASAFFAAVLVGALVTFALSEDDARADDTLHEGIGAEIGARFAQKSDAVALAHARADIAILPFPGGAELWNGPIDATRLEVTGREDLNPLGHPTVEHARVQLIRWPHVHLLGLEHDLRMGTLLGVEAIGLYLPLPLVGTIGGRSWLVTQLGANLGYMWLDTDPYRGAASRDGHVGKSTALAGMNAQWSLSDRWALRGLFEATYTAAVGSLSNKVGYVHAVVLNASVGIYADISRSAPVRLVPRTDPVTGDVTYRKETNEGKRVRLMVLSIEGEERPVDTITSVPDVVGAKIGIEYAY